MSGANQPPGAAPPSGGDPSMEDILASIRKILNEEDQPEGAAPAAAPAAEEAPAPQAVEPEDDVLMLDETMMVAEPAPEPEPATEPEAEQIQEAEQAEAMTLVEPEPEPPPAPYIPPLPDPALVDPLLSFNDLVAPAAAAAAASSVGNLVRTLAAERATKVYANGPTIEDLVREEIRPLLKEWLDANLPPMVERLVRLEIERVVGRVVP